MANDRTPGAFVEHAPCPGCGSSDALAVYEQEDGTYDGTCFSCEQYYKLDDDYAPVQRNRMQIAYQQETLESVLQFSSTQIADRGLRQEVVEDFGVKLSVNEVTGQHDAHYYPVYRNGHLTGYKKRYLPKTFTAVGDCKNSDLFGQNLKPGGGGRMVIVCEGEIDCMAAHQMTADTTKNRRPYTCVSLPNGADASAVKRNLEWLESFERVVLALDNDRQGQDATQIISELLSPGKAHIMRWPEDVKDCGEMLLRQGQNVFYQMIWDAAPHIPSGIVSGQDTWSTLHDRPRVESLPYPDNWELNPMTYGIRFGELDTWTSGSGSGKTQVMRELQYHILSKTDASVGIIALEEPLADTIEGLMSLYLGKRIHLPDVTYTTEEYRSAWEFVAGTNRIHLYDHWGSTDADTLFNKIRYLARGLDCKYVFLDHLSIVVSEFAGDGDERRQIDTIMSKLKNLTQELSIWIGLVVHLRKTTAGASFEEGAVPSTDDLRGSGSIKQLSNSVFAIARDQQHDNEYIRNTSSVHCLKCRFSGRTGPAGWLHFHGDSGRMIPVGDPDEYLAMQHTADEQALMADAVANGQA